MCILRQKWSSHFPNGVAEKLSKALKDTSSETGILQTDDWRKEQTWRQIQQQLNSVKQGTKRRTPHSRTTTRRTFLPQLRTSVAVISALGLGGYAIHIFSGSGARYSPTNSNTGVHVKPQKNLSSGETVTTLEAPSINPGNTRTAATFSPVSPDGKWMVTRSSSATSHVQSVNGQRNISIPGGISEVYGETPDGSLILGYAAGGGGVAEVLNPVTGVVQQLPGNADPAAHWVYQAAESTTGHWVMTVANSSGGPNQTWVDVDGHKISPLQSTREYAWSPDGNTLAAIVVPPGTGGVMTSSTPVEQRLALYNATTAKIQFPKQAVDSTTYGKVEQFSGWSNGPMWSPNGQYVLYQFWNDVYVFDTHSSLVTKLPVQSSSYLGFLANNDVYVVPGAQQTVELFAVQSGRVQTLHTWTAPSRINGVRASGQGLLIGLSGSSAGGAPGSGEIISLLDAHASTLVSRGADFWWYDSVDHQVYFFTQNSIGQVQVAGKVRKADVLNVMTSAGKSNAPSASGGSSS